MALMDGQYPYDHYPYEYYYFIMIGTVPPPLPLPYCYYANQSHAKMHRGVMHCTRGEHFSVAFLRSETGLTVGCVQPVSKKWSRTTGFNLMLTKV
jgi:hypothetical protein